MAPRAQVVAEKMLRDADHPLTDQAIVRVRPLLRQASDLLCQDQSAATLATMTSPQTQRDRNWYTVSLRLSAISRALVQIEQISGTAPLVYINDAPSAAFSFISHRESGFGLAPRAARACSTRLRHSSSSDSCVH